MVRGYNFKLMLLVKVVIMKLYSPQCFRSQHAEADNEAGLYYSTGQGSATRDWLSVYYISCNW